MAIKRIFWFWFRATNFTNSIANGFNSVEINMPPDWVGAQVSLHGLGAGGTVIAGIRQYRRRLPSGADEVHDFGATSPNSWPPVIFDFISSVTLVTYVAPNQGAYTAARLDFWN
jgi:hypothetical protein